MAVYFSRRDSRLVLTCEHCGEVGRELATDADRRRFAVTHVTACRERPEQRQRERAAWALLPELETVLELARDDVPDYLLAGETETRLHRLDRAVRRIRALLEVNDG